MAKKPKKGKRAKKELRPDAVDGAEAETGTTRVNTEDLIDARGVADLLGLAQRTSVSVYQQRYPDMPRPVVRLGGGRTLLWRRSEILQWARHTGRLS